MTKYSFTLGSRKYEYIIEKPFTEDKERLMRLSCPKLGIDQAFLVEDIPELILDLPNIAYNLKKSDSNNTVLRVRIKADEKKIIEKRALSEGKTTSAYIREKVLK